MAERNGQTLVVSVLGSTRLWDDVRELLRHGFATPDSDDVRVVLSQPMKLLPPSPPPPPERRAVAINSGNPAGYIVQVGAFRQKKRAEMLQQKLRKQGYAAYLSTTGKRSARLYRVRIGEFDTPLEARRVVGRLKSHMGLDGLVATSD
jgi:cell division septation protein DedD